MATCLGLGSTGRCLRYSVMQEIIRLVNNEFFCNSGHGRFFTSFKSCVARFHQQRYFKRRDFSLPSGHSNSILFPVISMIREV